MTTIQTQIVKVGSGLFRRLGVERVCALLADQIGTLCTERQIRTLVVTSGAGVCGELSMGGAKGFLKQTVASIGQPILMGCYRQAFAKFGLPVAQVLETDASILHRIEWQNTREVIDDCFARGAVPIANENDAVSVQQFLSDNDQLTALLAEALKPTGVQFITGIGGIYHDYNDSGCRLYRTIDHKNPPKIENGTSKDGRGGMAAKLRYAIECYTGGAQRVAITGLSEDVIVRFALGEFVPTMIGMETTFVE